MTLTLTPAEAGHVRTAARFLRARMGGWRAVAKALHVSRSTVRERTSPMLAFRIARLVGVGVDDVLTGRFPDPAVCPHCGQRAADPVE